MGNFDEFREGWWSCFLSFAEINEFYADSNDMPIMEVLEGAGVSVEEIDVALNDTSFQLSERLARYLNFYKNKKKNTNDRQRNFKCGASQNWRKTT